MLAQEYCLAAPGFGTVPLFVPQASKSKILPKRKWALPLTALIFERNLDGLCFASRALNSFGDRNPGTRTAPSKKEVPATMSTLHFRRVDRRRTARISVFADLTVQGFTLTNTRFKIHTRSLSVSGHGGLTVLDAEVAVGQTLLVTNENSGQKAECKIISIRPGGDGKNIVAFEFVSPQAEFWKMHFPASGTKPLRRNLPAAAGA